MQSNASAGDLLARCSRVTGVGLAGSDTRASGDLHATLQGGFACNCRGKLDHSN